MQSALQSKQLRQLPVPSTFSYSRLKQHNYSFLLSWAVATTAALHNQRRQWMHACCNKHVWEMQAVNCGATWNSEKVFMANRYIIRSAWCATSHIYKEDKGKHKHHLSLSLSFAVTVCYSCELALVCYKSSGLHRLLYVSVTIPGCGYTHCTR